jgi:hypothetical protein
LHRYIETHVGKIVYVTGEVFRVYEDSGKYETWLLIDGDLDQMIYIKNYQGVRVLEDDTLQIWGRVEGLYDNRLPEIESLVAEISH